MKAKVVAHTKEIEADARVASKLYQSEEVFGTKLSCFISVLSLEHLVSRSFRVQQLTNQVAE